MWEYRKRTLLFSIISLIATIYPTYTISTISSIQTLNATNFVSENQTLVSAGYKFELKFFKKSDKWYVGIQYKELPDTDRVNPYVWVANRDSPLSTSDGVLKIVNQSIFLLDQNRNPVWSSSSSSNTKGKNTYVQLLDNGNLFLRETGDPPDSQNYLWQSFDFPTDTLLPGMKLGRNRTTGFDRYLTSWRSPQDPSSGDFTVKLDGSGLPAIIVSEQQQGWTKFKSVSWDEIKFSGITYNQDLHLIKETNQGIPHWNVLYNCTLTDAVDTYFRLFVDDKGVLQSSYWIESSRDVIWRNLWYEPRTRCNEFGLCTAHSVCHHHYYANITCQCLRGFASHEMVVNDRKNGIHRVRRCGRNTPLECEEGRFLRLPNTELQDEVAFFDRNMPFKECEKQCKENCECTAYANPLNNGTGCAIWVGELRSLRATYTDDYPSSDLFVRIAASDLERKMRRRSEMQLLPFQRSQTNSDGDVGMQELQFFCFEELVTATKT